MDLRIVPSPKPSQSAPEPPVRNALLFEAPTRKRMQLTSIHLEPNLRRPLERMGIIAGRYVSLIYSDHKGTVVLELEGEHYILGRRETRHIRVRFR